MQFIKRLRLTCAKIFGPPVGEWQSENPAWKLGKYWSYRLLPSGDYEYRLITDEEDARRVVSNW